MVEVSTVQGFLDAVATSGASVKLTADIDVSKDNTYKDGFTSTIPISCTEIDFNGHYFKNFMFVNSLANCFNMGGTTTALTMKNGGFLNMICSENISSGVFNFGSYEMNFTDFKMSLLMRGQTNSIPLYKYRNSSSVLNILRCAFDIKQLGNGALWITDAIIRADQMALRYNGNFYNASNNGFLSSRSINTNSVKRSYVVGSINCVSTYAFNIIANYSGTTLISSSYFAINFTGLSATPNFANGSNQNCFIVAEETTDETQRAYVSAQTGMTNLTKEQAKSKAYLQSIGWLP